MSFRQQVYFIVKQIPSGKVATYGQIAALVGNHRAARQVGFALRALGLNEDNVPWWRVVNKEGYISIDHGDSGIEKMIQKDLLKKEGIEVSDNLIVDMGKFRWHTEQ